MKLKSPLMLALLAMVLASSCKKNKTPNPEPTGSRADLTRDSIFLYAKEIYLWNSALPSYETFNPRKYTSQSTPLDNYDQELFDITKYSAPYEYKAGASSPKFSYIQDRADKNPKAVIATTSSVDLEGNGNDFGIRLGLFGTDASYTMYVSAVYQNSPAEKAGFVRGDKIVKMNGVTYGTNFSTAQSNAINTALNGTTLNLEGIKSTGQSYTASLTKAIFKSSPIYKTKVITAGSRKIGYLAYARFSSPENSNAELDAAFSSFSANGITDLIIDLRYNGGGYVATSEYLANLIAPSGTSGVMYTETYNATMQAGNAKILSRQPLLDDNGRVQYQNGKMVTYADVNYSIGANTNNFAKKGPVGNVQNVVFIVTGSTASASELLINNLKPHMNVKLVGLTTYGKPVGFFPITIENKYDVYYSLFESKNSLGQGGYYDGMTPDVVASEIPTSTIMYDFGDVNDNYVKKAINVLAPGVVATSQAKLSTVQERNLAVNSSAVIQTNLDNKEFVGMVETRFKMKH